MTTRTVQKSYENGSGVEVTFLNNGEEIGKACTAYYDGKPNSFLHGLEIGEKYRNKGFGAAVLAYMVDTYDVDTLYVATNNNVAIHLYKKFGFEFACRYDERFIFMKRKKMDGGNEDDL